MQYIRAEVPLKVDGRKYTFKYILCTIYASLKFDHLLRGPRALGRNGDVRKGSWVSLAAGAN